MDGRNELVAARDWARKRFNEGRDAEWAAYRLMQIMEACNKPIQGMDAFEETRINTLRMIDRGDITKASSPESAVRPATTLRLAESTDRPRTALPPDEPPDLLLPT